MYGIYENLMVLTKVLFIALILNQTTEALFVSVGEYPEYSQYGVNQPECGLRYVAQTLTHPQKCFAHKYPNTTYIQKHRRRPNSVSARIAHGIDAEFNVAPYAVRLYIAPLDETCSGSLVTLDVVLTAAHCLANKSLSNNDITIFAGGNTRAGLETDNPDKWTIQSQYYNAPAHISGPYDIAVIKLKNGFTRKTSSDGEQYLFNTICLPKVNQTNNILENATFFGHGLAWTEERGYFNPDYLQKGETAIIPFKFSLVRNMIQSNPEGLESRLCTGDSGGPLLQYLEESRIRAVIIGTTVMHGNDECRLSNMNFWTSVSFNLNWILESIKTFKK